MSTQEATSNPQPVEPTGFPEFTDLGRRIERLRVDRGVSKQHLARYAATSRQQLWRVMTGKSELTPALRDRLAAALGVEAAQLTSPEPVATTTLSSAALPLQSGMAGGLDAIRAPGPDALAAYLASAGRLETTLGSLPSGTDGRRLKRQLLNSLEDLALERGLTLPGFYFDLRRRVLAGEL